MIVNCVEAYCIANCVCALSLLATILVVAACMLSSDISCEEEDHYGFH